MSDLATLIAAAPESLRLDAAALAAYLNAPRFAPVQNTVDRAKGAARLDNEQALRLVLDGIGVPAPIPAGTMAALLATSPANDAHRDALIRAVALRGELRALGLEDADFTAEHFGQASYAETVTRMEQQPSLAAEALGQAVTDDAVRAVLKSLTPETDL